MMAHLLAHPDYAGMPSATYIPAFHEAVKEAYRQTCEGETILLSPAAASFDSFSSYEERGERFCQILLQN
jgi:UDP-N-acetylmuramoylalanine--D-glutamate ligase